MMVIVCGDFNSNPLASSVSLFHNNQHIVKNKHHSKLFDMWYEMIWGDLQSDPHIGAIKSKLKSSYV